jgi:hypothetical protein
MVFGLATTLLPLLLGHRAGHVRSRRQAPHRQ